MIAAGAAREAGLAKWAAYATNPRAFVYDLFRTNDGKPLELEPYQVEILEAVAHGKDTTVRSGHGVGKTTTDALAVYHYLLTHPFSKVPTTAPTFRQVKDILWAEIAKWFHNFRLKSHLNLQTTKLEVLGREAEWFAIGVASNRPENIEGFHADHVLFVVDEAKGVQKAIYDSIDGALTTGGQRLYTSTPGSRVGQFYESHFGRIAKFFHRIHINGETSRRVSKAWVLQKVEEWGRDSPIYQSKVLGEFPNEGDDILIRLDYILAAEEAFQELHCEACGKLYGDGCTHDPATMRPAIGHAKLRALGLDVARFGMDKSALAYGSSSRIEWVRTREKSDLVSTTLWAVKHARGPEAVADVSSIGVDDTGLGGGVTDMLSKIHEFPNMPVVFGSTSELTSGDRKEHFHNNKAWLAWKFKKALEENYLEREKGHVGTFALCNDDVLKGQLSNLRTRQRPKGQIQIIDPDDPTIPISELPKGVRVSPDRAHAALICYHTATSSAGLAGGLLKPPDGIRPNHDAKRRLSHFVFKGGLSMR
jgi:phage terminase large subunit